MSPRIFTAIIDWMKLLLTNKEKIKRNRFDLGSQKNKNSVLTMLSVRYVLAFQVVTLGKQIYL